jgi:hypothetical protein
LPQGHLTEQVLSASHGSDVSMETSSTGTTITQLQVQELATMNNAHNNKILKRNMFEPMKVMTWFSDQ